MRYTFKKFLLKLIIIKLISFKFDFSNIILLDNDNTKIKLFIF